MARYKKRTDKQRRAMFARMNSRGNVTIQPGFRRIRITKSTTDKDIDNYVQSIKKSPKIQNLSPENRAKINKALNELKKIKTRDKIELWVAKHRKLFYSTGLIGLVGLGVSMAAVLPTVELLGFGGPFKGTLTVPAANATRYILGSAAAGTAAGIGVLGGGVSRLRTKKAKILFLNRDKEIKKIQQKGFTKTQASKFVDLKILRAEAKEKNNKLPYASGKTFKSNIKNKTRRKFETLYFKR